MTDKDNNPNPDILLLLRDADSAPDEEKATVEDAEVTQLKRLVSFLGEMIGVPCPSEIRAGDANSNESPITIPGAGLLDNTTGLAGEEPASVPHELLQHVLDLQREVRKKDGTNEPAPHDHFVMVHDDVKYNLLAQLAVVHCNRESIRELLPSSHGILPNTFETLFVNFEKTLKTQGYTNLAGIANAMGVTGKRRTTRLVTAVRENDTTGSPSTLPDPSSFTVAKYYFGLGGVFEAAGKEAFEDLASPVRQVAQNMVDQYAIAHSGAKTTASIKNTYKIQGFLGKGNFGAVLRATRKDDAGEEESVVIKIFDVTLPLSFNMKEIRNAKTLSCFPLIPTLLATNVNPYMSYMTMELVNGGDLDETNDLPEEEVKLLLSHLASSMAYMDATHFAHRDLKPGNVGKMVSASGPTRYLVFDMGFATNKKMTDTYCGTPLTMAPEVSAGERYNPCRADWYSFGATVLYVSIPLEDIFRLYLEGGFNLESVRAKLEEKQFSPATIDIITRLLAFDPADRITPLQILEHEALESVPDPFKTIPGMDKYRWVLDVLKDRRTKEQQTIEIAELTERLAKAEASLAAASAVAAPDV